MYCRKIKKSSSAFTQQLQSGHESHSNLANKCSLVSEEPTLEKSERAMFTAGSFSPWLSQVFDASVCWNSRELTHRIVFDSHLQIVFTIFLIILVII